MWFYENKSIQKKSKILTNFECFELSTSFVHLAFQFFPTWPKFLRQVSVDDFNKIWFLYIKFYILDMQLST